MKMDLIAVVGEYTNAAGENKKRFVKVGTLFDKGNGMSIKIDAIPAAGWDGWLSAKSQMEQRTDQRQGQRQQYRGLPKDEDDTPF